MPRAARHGLEVIEAALLAPERVEAHACSRDALHGLRDLCGVTYSTAGSWSGSPPSEAELADIARALEPVGRHAPDLGTTIRVEPCNRHEIHLLDTPARAVAMFERIGEPNVTIHLDTYHMNIEEKGLAAGFRTAGRRCA